MASSSSPVAAAGATPSSATSSPATEGVLPTVSNFQATAGANIQNAGATALAQIAAAGSKGQAAIQQAQSQNAAAKTAAIQAVMANSALHGAGAQFGQNSAQQSVVPLTDRSQDLTDMAANYAANNQGLQAANANYFQGLQGALPIDQAALSMDISNDQAKAAAAASAANVKAQTDQLDLQKAQLAAQPKPLTLAQVISQNGGASVLGQSLNAGATQAAQSPAAMLGNTGMPNLAGGGGAPVTAGPDNANSAQAANNYYGNADQAISALMGGAPVVPGQAQRIATSAEAPALKAGTTAQAAQPKTPAEQHQTMITAEAFLSGTYPNANGKGYMPPQSVNAVAAWIVSQGGYTPADALSLAKTLAANNTAAAPNTPTAANPLGTSATP